MEFINVSISVVISFLTELMRAIQEVHDFNQPAINWKNEVVELDDHPSDGACRTQGAGEEDLDRFVRHPWGIIDYFLYLSVVENGREWETRIDEGMLLEEKGFYPVRFHDLCHVEETFSRVRPGTDPMMFFVSLPVPNNVNEFSGRRLFLGFDLGKHHLLGYLLESGSADIRETVGEWEHGQLVIDIHVHRFIDILEYSVEHRPEVLQIGIFRYFQEATRAFPVGLDMVIAIQFAQFLDDFADLLWTDNAEHFRKEYKHLEDDLRRILQRASCESWFGSRRKLTIDQYRRHKLQDFISSELLLCNPQRTAPVVRVEAPRFLRQTTTTPHAVRQAPACSWVEDSRQHKKSFVLLAVFVLFSLIAWQLVFSLWR